MIEILQKTNIFKEFAYILEKQLTFLEILKIY